MREAYGARDMKRPGSALPGRSISDFTSISGLGESLFEVGKNVATTEGAVVYENELFQLLEYKPLTAKV